jgi:hypothetical protein
VGRPPHCKERVARLQIVVRRCSWLRTQQCYCLNMAYRLPYWWHFYSRLNHVRLPSLDKGRPVLFQWWITWTDIPKCARRMNYLLITLAKCSTFAVPNCGFLAVVVEEVSRL